MQKSGHFDYEGSRYYYKSVFDGQKWVGELTDYPEKVVSYAPSELRIIDCFWSALQTHFEQCNEYEFHVHYVTDETVSIGIAEMSIQKHYSDIMSIRAKERRLPGSLEISKWCKQLGGTVLNYIPLP